MVLHLKVIEKYMHIVFMILLFGILVFLFKIKVFSFPVHESIFFIVATETFQGSISTFWHTPTYFLVLFFFRQLFNDPFVAAQMIGLLSVYSSSLIIFLIIKKLEFKMDLSPELKYIASAVNIIYVPIYNSIFLFDIDNTILVPCLLFSIYYFIANIHEEKKFQKTLLLIMLFWIKEVVYFPVLIFFVIIYCLEFGINTGLKKSFPIVVISLMFNFISYGIFSHIIFGNWGAIAFNGSKLLSMGNEHSFSMKRLIMKAGSVFLWGGPIFYILILVNIRKIIKDKLLRYFAIFIFFYLFVFIVPWPAEGGGWPKYAISVFPFLIVIGIIILKSVDYKKIAILVVPLGLLYFLLGDYMYELYHTIQYNDFDIYRITGWVFWYFLFPLGFIICMKKYSRQSISFLIFVFFISQNIGLLGNQINADYSTNYNYGVRGIEKVFRYVKENNLESITSFPIYDQLFKQEKNKVKTIFIERDLFFSATQYKNPGKEKRYIEIVNNYQKIKQIGNYQVWEKINLIRNNNSSFLNYSDTTP